MNPYTIVLADDHSLMRDGIKNILSAVTGLRIVGEASDGIETLKLLHGIRPDMLILDISMPGMHGIEVAREVRRNYPDMHILFLSMHKSIELIEIAMETGVRGYLLKEDSAAELLTAIDQIKRGKTYLSKRLLPMLPTDILDIRARKSSQPSESLSHRQCQVLKLVAEGKTSDEIGRLLHISARTVHRHRENIRKKLRIKGTPELVQYAITKGYLIAAEGVLPVL